MTNSKERTYLIETDPEITQTMALTAKIFKTIIINMVKGMEGKCGKNEKNKIYKNTEWNS